MRAQIVVSAIILFITGAAAMSDNSKQGRLAGIGAGDPRMTQQKTESEMHMDMLFEKVRTGEMTMRDALRAHRNKFHGGQMPDYGKALPAQPPGMMRRPDVKSPF